MIQPSSYSLLILYMFVIFLAVVVPFMCFALGRLYGRSVSDYLSYKKGVEDERRNNNDRVLKLAIEMLSQRVPEIQGMVQGKLRSPDGNTIRLNLSIVGKRECALQAVDRESRGA